jgi:L-aspartate oxidase
VVIVGSGVAGLTAALHARRTGRTVLLVTKGRVEEGSTRWAQGGIAAALADDDTPEEHLHDTLVAGAGLCDVDAVAALVTEGPDCVRNLIGLGAHFDLDASGAIALTREGGHHRDRIAHAGGDATGAEISRALVAAVALDPGIELIEGALVLALGRIDEAKGAAALQVGAHDGRHCHRPGAFPAQCSDCDGARRRPDAADLDAELGSRWPGQQGGAEGGSEASARPHVRGF